MTDVFLMGTIDAKPGEEAGWRWGVIEKLNGIDRSYYNPIVKNWTPADGDREAEALQKAKIVAMAITSATLSQASIGESGWAAFAMNDNEQTLVIYIEDHDPEFVEAAIANSDIVIDGNQRARTLIRKHAEKAAERHPATIFVTSNYKEFVAKIVELAKELEHA